MALVTSGIHYHGMPVLHIGRPVSVEGLLYLVHVELFGKHRADIADDLEVGKSIAAKIDPTEELVLRIAVELLHQPVVRRSRVVFEEHQCKFALGREDGSRALFGFLEPEGLHKIVPGNRQIYPPQIALEKAVIKNVELFALGGKRKGVLEVVDSLYFVHYRKLKTPFFELHTHFRGFDIPKYTTYLSDNQILMLFMNVPLCTPFILT